MIVHVFSATISPGKRSEAQDFWKRVASYNKKQAGVEDCIVMHPLHGLRNRISRATRFSSLAALEDLHKKMREDPERRALAKEQSENHYTVSRYDGDIAVQGSRLRPLLG